MPSVALGEILAYLGSAVIRVAGPVDRSVTHPAPISDTKASGAITFCSKTGPAAEQLIQRTGAEIVLCHDEPQWDERTAAPRTLLLVARPRLQFARVTRTFFAEPPPRGVHPTAVIDPQAVIGSEVSIGPFCYVGKCEIGAGTSLQGRVYIYSNTRIGRRVTVHAGTVIGSDGFGYERDENGEWVKFPHVGGVVIDDNVEIGANCCIDRGTLGDTWLGEGVKLDNLVHIAHNDRIGKRCTIAASAMLAGSVTVGDDVWIGPGASISSEITIGDGASITIGSVVTRDAAPGQRVSGNFAIEHDRFIAFIKSIR